METKLENKITELAELYKPYEELIPIEFFEDFDQKLLEEYLSMLIDMKKRIQKPIQKAYNHFVAGEFLKPTPLIKLLFVANQMQLQIESISYYLAERFGLDNLFIIDEE